MTTSGSSHPLATRLALRVAVGALCLAALLVAGVYASSEWMLQRRRDAPLEPIAAVTSERELAEGRRMAILVGCWAGCHGMEGEGGEEGFEGLFNAAAPALSAALASYRDDELARLIRYGVKRDGRTAIGMPARVFYPLGPEDLARIISHLRRSPARAGPASDRSIPLSGRIALLRGEWKVSADQVDATRPRWGSLPRITPFERGRYLASITCSECHGLDLRGDALEGGPSLALVGGYRLAELRHLLRTGEPTSGRDLGIMSWSARNAFAHFTDGEIEDLFVFLRRTFGFD